MPREFSRTRRVGELMQRELARIIPREILDSRLGLMSVTSVDLAKDFSVATVYVSRVGGEGEAGPALALLEEAAPHLRHCLSEQVNLRTTPRLRFRYDPAIEHGDRVMAALAQISREEEH